jgi:hypothetical protein
LDRTPSGWVREKLNEPYGVVVVLLDPRGDISGGMAAKERGEGLSAENTEGPRQALLDLDPTLRHKGPGELLHLSSREFGQLLRSHSVEPKVLGKAEGIVLEPSPQRRIGVKPRQKLLKRI